MRALATAVTLLTASYAPMVAEPPCRCDCEVDLVRLAHLGRPVFLGTVTRVQFLDVLQDDHAEPRIIVDLDVHRSWGRDVPARFTLHTYFNRMNCDGYWFEEGETYLLAAWPNVSTFRRPEHPEWPPSDTFGTWFCGVHELEHALTEIQRLDRNFLGRL